MNQIKKLKDQIHQLINQRNKQLTNLLTHYQNDAGILRILAELDEIAEEVLWVNLTWRAISRNNHQHLDLKTQFKGNLLAAIEQEFALTTANNLFANELTDEELLQQLSLRIKSGVIKSCKEGECYDSSEESYPKKCSVYLTNDQGNKLIEVELATGKIAEKEK